MLLSRDQILNGAQPRTESVHIPEFGGDMLLRGLTADEADEYEGENIEVKGEQIVLNRKQQRARLIQRCAINQDGSQLFSKDDIPALGRLPGAALQKAFVVAQSLSGLGPEANESLGKDSESTQPVVSLSPLRAS